MENLSGAAARTGKFSNNNGKKEYNRKEFTFILNK